MWKELQTWESRTVWVSRGSWSIVLESKRRWGLIKNEQGREWNGKLVWFLEINKDYPQTPSQKNFKKNMLSSLSSHLWRGWWKQQSPQFSSKKWAMDPQTSILSSCLHQVKGIKRRNEGEQCDCTLVNPFTKTKRVLWQPWSITMKEVEWDRAAVWMVWVETVGSSTVYIPLLH